MCQKFKEVRVISCVDAVYFRIYRKLIFIINRVNYR